MAVLVKHDPKTTRKGLASPMQPKTKAQQTKSGRKTPGSSRHVVAAQARSASAKKGAATKARKSSARKGAATRKESVARGRNTQATNMAAAASRRVSKGSHQSSPKVGAPDSNRSGLSHLRHMASDKVGHVVKGLRGHDPRSMSSHPFGPADAASRRGGYEGHQWKHGWIPLTPRAVALKTHKMRGSTSGKPGTLTATGHHLK